MMYLFMGLFGLFIVAADQVTKYLTVANIPLGGHAPFIPGLLSFTFHENTGGGWSILEGKTWLLVALTLVFFAMMIWSIYKKWLTGTGTLWSLTAIMAGAVGNLIDRLARDGKVVDMLQTDFMDFPIFNVADCFITCGAIALCVFFFWEEKQERKQKQKQQEEAE